MLIPVAIDPEGIAGDNKSTEWGDRAVECVKTMPKK
jgi:hypothetical protein